MRADTSRAATRCSTADASVIGATTASSTPLSPATSVR
jgi:hypothetical protein